MVVTAKEFYELVTNPERFKGSSLEYKEYAIEAFKEFARLHVKAALEAAADNSCKMSSTRDTVINSYDLDNIK